MNKITKLIDYELKLYSQQLLIFSVSLGAIYVLHLSVDELKHIILLHLFIDPTSVFNFSWNTMDFQLFQALISCLGYHKVFLDLSF